MLDLLHCKVDLDTFPVTPDGVPKMNPWSFDVFQWSRFQFIRALSGSSAFCVPGSSIICLHNIVLHCVVHCVWLTLLSARFATLQGRFGHLPNDPWWRTQDESVNFWGLSTPPFPVYSYVVWFSRFLGSRGRHFHVQWPSSDFEHVPNWNPNFVRG